MTERWIPSIQFRRRRMLPAEEDDEKEDGRTGVQVASAAWNTAAYAIWLMASALLSIIDTLRCQGSRSWPLLRQRHLASSDRCSPARLAKNPPVSLSRSSSFEKDGKKGRKNVQFSRSIVHTRRETRISTDIDIVNIYISVFSCIEG